MSCGATAGDPMLLKVNPRSSSDDCRDVYARKGVVSENAETRGSVIAAAVTAVASRDKCMIKESM